MRRVWDWKNIFFRRHIRPCLSNALRPIVIWLWLCNILASLLSEHFAVKWVDGWESVLSKIKYLRLVLLLCTVCSYNKLCTFETPTAGHGRTADVSSNERNEKRNLITTTTTGNVYCASVCEYIAKKIITTFVRGTGDRTKSCHVRIAFERKLIW